MIADLTIAEDVPVRCLGCKMGVLHRVGLSRLEEGLGHEGYKCDECDFTVKRVPKTETA